MNIFVSVFVIICIVHLCKYVCLCVCDYVTSGHYMCVCTTLCIFVYVYMEAYLPYIHVQMYLHSPLFFFRRNYLLVVKMIRIKGKRC